MKCEKLRKTARSPMNSHIEYHTDREPIIYQNAAFGLALGESVTRVAEKTGLSRRTIQHKLQEEAFVDNVRYWQDLYTQTLTDFLTTDLRRSIRNALVKSVSKGEALGSHPNRVAFTSHTAAPKEADELEGLAKKAEMRQKMLK
jgi:hypothetical protein